jgi:hypothetical protein
MCRVRPFRVDRELQNTFRIPNILGVVIDALAPGACLAAIYLNDCSVGCARC